MTKIEQIIEKCVEANPEIVVNENAQLIKHDHTVEYFRQLRPIRLADILLAIGKKPLLTRYLQKFIWEDWNLKETLKNQSEPTKDLIHKLLHD